MTTSSPLTLEALGEALAEVAPEIVVLPPPGATTLEERDLSSLEAFEFALLAGDDPVATEISDIFVRSDAGGAKIILTASYDIGAFAVVLGIAAAALHASGGRYGDDADRDWPLEEVLVEYARERESFLASWSETPPEARAALTARPREALLHARITAACGRGKELELRSILRGNATPAAIATAFDAAWRADNPAAASAALAECSPEVVLEALARALNVVGFTGVRQASFLVEKAHVLSALDPGALSSLARALPLSDPDVRALIERAVDGARRPS